MSTNFLQEGDVLTFTAPTGGTTKGTGVLIGGLLVIPLDTVAQTLPFRGKATGVWSHAKTDSQAWTEGVVIYWDNTNKVMTTASASNFRVGVAVEAVGGGAGLTTGKVRLNGVGVTVVGGAAP